MSDPKMQHIQGDVNISPGLEASLGDGSLFITGVNSQLDVNGETFLNKSNIDTTNGLFSVTGTNKVSFAPTGASGNIELLGSTNSFLRSSAGTMSVQAQAGALSLTGNSTTVVSDTTTVGVTGATGVTITSSANNVNVNSAANFDVNASSAVILDANAASNFTVTGGGNLTVDSTAGRVIIDGGANATNAVTISSSAAAGGVDINAGTGGFDVLATGGPFSIDGQNVASNISLATNANAQDFTIALSGATDSSIILTSSGTGVDAVSLNASSATGGITVVSGTNGIDALTTGSISLDAAGNSNFTTTGAFDLSLISTAGTTSLLGGEAVVNAVIISSTNAAGGIDVNAGTGGITIDTTAGFSIDSTNTSNITLTGTDDLTINNTGGKVILRSARAAVDAVRIFASNAAGGIDVDSGTGGITVDSQGAVSIDAVGASSNFSLSTNGAAQDLTIGVTGATNSSLVLSSTGTSTTDAISIAASAGGILMTSAGKVEIDTTSTALGISIGTTTPGLPIAIGSSTSETTISGNLTVSGTTTTVNTETLTIQDNVIVLNSSNGELGADGGMIIRRNQTPNGSGGGGDVVLDTGAGVISSSFQAGSATPGTLVLNAGASAVDGTYDGWWVKVTSGAGNNQVRRIKTYVGATKTATLYVTADNGANFTDGLNLVTAPAATNTYNLYNSPYVSSFYKESSDKWLLAFTNLVPDTVGAVGISTVTVQRYANLDSGAITIQSNGVPGNSVLLVNYINEFTTNQGVTIEGVLIQDGLINGAALDITEIVQLPDNATTLVEVTNTATIGSYMVIVDAVQSNTGPSSYLRQSGGAFSVFAIASSGTGGALNRLASSKGSANQRVDGDWATGEKFKIQHKPALTGGTGTLKPYRVKVQRVV